MISQKTCEKVLVKALETGGDFAEIFAERTASNTVELVSGKVNKVGTTYLYGAGIRILLGTKEVYGYTNDLSENGLILLAEKLNGAYNENVKITNVKLLEEEVVCKHPVNKDPVELSNEEKIEYLNKVYEGAKSASDEITQVLCSFSADKQNVLICNSNGLLKKDTRVHERITCNCVAGSGANMQTAFESMGRHQGAELYDNKGLEVWGKEIAQTAVKMLHADEMVGGKMTVVVHNAFGGVLLHEACVHSLEATSVARGASVFCGKLGQKIASDIVNAVDDGTLTNNWGSLNIDDEGTPTRRNVLIENGVLKSYLVDYRNSRKMNHEITGSGRRQSYKFSPTSRMTNTFFLPGKSTFEEIISATKYGLFAKRMGGGSVNPATGEFNFNVSEGYMIEDGKITKPVRGATLVGSGAEILLNIDMIADNLSYGQGMCGSLSGSIPTDVGQPTIRVQNITVGGRG